MSSIDLRTVILMSSVMPGLMSIVLFSLSRSFPSSIKGIRYWAAAAAFIAVTAVLLALRGAVADGVSVVVANTSLLIGIGLSLIGTELFFEREPSWSLVIVAILFGGASVSWMLWVHPNYFGRVSCMTALLTVFYAAHTRLLLFWGSRNYNTLFLGAMFLILSVSTAIRFISSMSPGDAAPDLFAHDPFQLTYLAVNNFMSLLVTVGFVMVATNRLHAQLERQSATDPLTGLLNRRAFGILHAKTQERARRLGQPLTMLIVDLDHFKTINDRFGHDTGDRVLVDFAERVTAVLGPNDHLARFGGEEFAILLADANAQEAFGRASAIRQLVQLRVDRDLPIYTCSIGVACLDATDASLARLSSVADRALYRAKSNGRNRVELTDEALAAG
ncbi:GGDEF domain-containing protein [Paraburkholderia xenovorans]|uniref:GGDEF domain-containing protein n=1 Tax=Paraburkholderia xenovorans TaxID=36873 RepID=UPI0038BACAE2